MLPTSAIGISGPSSNLRSTRYPRRAYDAMIAVRKGTEGKEVKAYIHM